MYRLSLHRKHGRKSWGEIKAFTKEEVEATTSRSLNKFMAKKSKNFMERLQQRRAQLSETQFKFYIYETQGKVMADVMWQERRYMKVSTWGRRKGVG